MNTYVIPWMSKEETERFLRELKQPPRADKDQPGVAKPAAAPLPCLTQPDTGNSSHSALDLGCL